MTELHRERSVAVELARAGGALLRAEVERPGGPRGAGSKAPVDDAICELVVEGLVRAFPADTIVSEELPERPGSSGRVWHVDPHDGTKHFLRGARDTCVSIALARGSQLRLGVVHAPIPGELTGPGGLLLDWAAGEPLRRDERPLEPLPGAEDLQGGGRILVSPGLRAEVRAWNAELVAPAELAGCGSPATRLALVAAGEALAGISLGVQLAGWDYAAGQALLEAAGGALVDEQGQRQPWADGRPAGRARAFFGAASPALAAELARRYREALEARRRG